MSVVSSRFLPVSHPSLLVLWRQETASWLVAVLLPDTNGMVFGHDAVVAGWLEKVALWMKRKGEGRINTFSSRSQQ